ncbi:YusW family protein [Gracilibacillus massiliensis]|uniref:YusW family protein n=1 Tax=Gracilibacillus massiliensis TaxID=1564956 RepID=UPI00071CB287|nr:YusW family protein [Gracilibacillus massiliensis]
MKASDANPSTKYSFTKLELEADFEDINDTLEVEYENEQNDEMEASYKDKSQDIDLNGEVAMEELDRIFSSFTFDQNTTEDEVLKTITDAFNIPKDAQKLELEIQFGT